MAKKDKFAQMQQDGGIRSFQDSLVQAATTVAAIERKNQMEEQHASIPAPQSPAAPRTTGAIVAEQRFMRLPNPQIPLTEYNLVSNYCSSFTNMTRQDFVELAIIEKLHNDGGMSQEDFNRRYEEIRNRLPRGQRKGTKNARQSAGEGSSSSN